MKGGLKRCSLAPSLFVCVYFSASSGIYATFRGSLICLVFFFCLPPGVLTDHLAIVLATLFISTGGNQSFERERPPQNLFSALQIHVSNLLSDEHWLFLFPCFISVGHSLTAQGPGISPPHEATLERRGGLVGQFLRSVLLLADRIALYHCLMHGSDCV